MFLTIQGIVFAIITKFITLLTTNQIILQLVLYAQIRAPLSTVAGRLVVLLLHSDLPPKLVCLRYISLPSASPPSYSRGKPLSLARPQDSSYLLHCTLNCHHHPGSLLPLSKAPDYHTVNLLFQSKAFIIVCTFASYYQPSHSKGLLFKTLQVENAAMNSFHLVVEIFFKKYFPNL